MKRSMHNLSHYRLFSANQGALLPISCQEVLPGDTFRHSTQALMRVSPLVSPVMHPVQVRLHHFFVPNRILWDGWEEFITGNSGPDAELPVATLASPSLEGDLFDYLGIPPGTEGDINQLPVRAYNTIWNEFFRDQDLDAVASVNSTIIRSVAWEKDYFTIARPYPQQGPDTVTISFSGSGNAPLVGNAELQQDTGSGYVSTSPTAGGTDGLVSTNQTDSGSPDPVRWSLENASADLTSGTTNLDVNSWRTAMAQQRILEHRSRFGSRYKDYLRFLGVNSDDKRLDRPEYLGGGKATVSFSEVLATGASTGVNVGDMKGHGIATVSSRPYRKFFPEHGYVISLFSVRPKTIYSSSMPRTFLRRTYDDFWQKENEMMGQQPVTNREIYSQSATPTDVFGWIDRHEEYRRSHSGISGEFHGVLDYWHMARMFDSQPALNSDFVTSNPTDRIYASTDTDQLYVMASHRLRALRLVTKRHRA